MKYKLINTNSGLASVTLANGSRVRIAPGEKNALPLGEIPNDQVVAYRALSKVGVLLRKDEAPKKTPEPKKAPEAPEIVTPPEEPETEEPTKDLTEEQVKARDEFLKGRTVGSLNNAEIKELYEAMGLPNPRPNNRPACEKAIIGE